MRKETVGCSPMVTEAEGKMSRRRREHNTPSESPCTQLKRVTKREALADQGFARCRDAKPEAPHWLSRPISPGSTASQVWTRPSYSNTLGLLIYLALLAVILGITHTFSGA